MDLFGLVNQAWQGAWAALAQSVPGAAPDLANVLVGIALALGIVLWLLGAKVLKGVFAAMGAVTGGFAGAILLPLSGVNDLFGIPIEFWGLGGGAIVGLGLAFALFRVAVAGAAGLTLGVLGLMGGMAYAVQTSPPPEPPAEVEAAPRARSAGPAATFLSREEIEEAAAEVGEAAGVVLADARERSEHFLDTVRESMSRRWEAMEPKGRSVVVAAAVGGAFVGVLLGLLAPKRSTALVTALAGAGVMVGAALWLFEALAPERAEGLGLLDRPASTWLIVWGVLGVIGLLVQWAGMKKGKGDE